MFGRARTPLHDHHSNPDGNFGSIRSIYENYEDDDVIERTVSLPEGEHSFTANCQYCSFTDGWHGGFWSVMDRQRYKSAAGSTYIHR